MEFTSLLYRRRNGDTVTETYRDGAWHIALSQKEETAVLAMYDCADLQKSVSRELYAGMDLDALLDSGKDILGEKLLRQGNFTYADVETLLPPVRTDAYCFLSGPAAWGSVTVNIEGEIIPGLSGAQRKPNPIFAPAEVDPDLGSRMPKQMLLGRKYPLLLSVHTDGENVLEFLYFVEPGDPDRDPIVWIRIKEYRLTSPDDAGITYRIASLSRKTGRVIEKETFLNALAETVSFWVRFGKQGTAFDLPEKTPEIAAEGLMMAAAHTFTGPHAHYGHLWYGDEVHDNFPPNYLWTLEAACLLGREAWARQIREHLFTYVLNDEGRFVYRQGEHEIYGASAEEYGELLFILCRYREKLDFARWTEEDTEKLMGIGELILDVCVPCPEFDDRVFVRMCAEADTNTRVHVYLNNNLWAIRGLEALDTLLSLKGLEGKRFSAMAALLRKNVTEVLASVTKETRFGSLPPFRLGYTAEPATLSNCRDTFSAMTDSEYKAYMTVSHMRAQGSDQDLTENTYANYRYYPEALSAMLLSKEQAEAIVNMRENLGGEFLAMTRFYRWFDDWPVLHYARYLLETGKTDKFRLLLYAHTAHQGHPDLMCYYEQTDAVGAVRAPDCIPSLLTTPIMTGWMFAYETVETGELRLLSAVPHSWYEKPFSVKNLGYSGGSCDILWDGKTLEVSFSRPLHQRCVICGVTAVPDDSGDAPENAVTLREGITHIKLRLKF